MLRLPICDGSGRFLVQVEEEEAQDPLALHLVDAREWAEFERSDVLRRSEVTRWWRRVCP